MGVRIEVCEVLLGLLWVVVLCGWVAEGWLQGRATYFDAPDYWKAEFPPGKFGDLFGNTCGYRNRRNEVPLSNEDFPFPFDGVGAITDVMPGHVGGCGRCYEVRCKTGPVLKDQDTIASVYEGYHLPRFVHQTLQDPQGREWSGVPEHVPEEHKWTQCRDEGESIVIKTIDYCPCVYIGGREQQWCCGPIDHLDLSFWAFNKLAHPLYGMMMVEYRPVDCRTRQPLENRSFVSNVIYDGEPEAGWGIGNYLAREFTLMDGANGLQGSPAACIRLASRGRLSFVCRECYKPEAQPFREKSAIRFWIKSYPKWGSSSTISGAVPEVFISLSQTIQPYYSTTGQVTFPETFCNNKVDLKYYTPVASIDDWSQFLIPLADFQCADTLKLEDLNRFSFEDQGPFGDNKEQAEFCVNQIDIVEQDDPILGY